jgi:hypothetical protein
MVRGCVVASAGMVASIRRRRVREYLERKETRFNGKDLSCFRMVGRGDGVIVCYVWWRVNRDGG